MKDVIKSLNKHHKLMFLYMVFGVSLVIANVIAPKLFTTGITLFGSPVILTTGIIVYPVTFLITDIIGELWGKTDANRLVLFGFIVQVIASIYVIIAAIVPPADPDVQNAYMTMLGMNWLIMLGSMTAYLTSQTCDVFLFHKLREIILKISNNNRKLRFLWNNLSTLLSQFVDSLVFVTIVFGIGFGWLFDPALGISFVLVQIFSQYVFKLLLALIDTPIFILLTRNK